MYQTKFLNSIQEISTIEWNGLQAQTYPFLKHEFLSLLESSGSVSLQAGWQPQHLIVYRESQIVAAMPLYIKMHSYGEYVFDWSWARAYQEHGLAYLPKLVTCVPFTPCSGARILIDPNENSVAVIAFIFESIKNFCESEKLSGWHCLFPPQENSMQQLKCDADLMQRIDVQFHWHNRDYANWDEFVQQLQSRKRKNILKERQAVLSQGISFSTKTGADISLDDLQIFYQFYCSTYLKRSGHKGYLSLAFFLGLATDFLSQLVLIEAHHSDATIAAALFFRDAETLYGRYWGCHENYDFLHFETCYYQGIDYAISQGIKRFDGGAQGEHKIARGFEPQFTYSNHWIRRTDFRDAIKKFVLQERDSVLAYCDEVKSHSPFKNK